jgi:hypothetical protein
MLMAHVDIKPRLIHKYAVAQVVHVSLTLLLSPLFSFNEPSFRVSRYMMTSNPLNFQAAFIFDEER